MIDPAEVRPAETATLDPSDFQKFCGYNVYRDLGPKHRSGDTFCDAFYDAMHADWSTSLALTNKRAMYRKMGHKMRHRMRHRMCHSFCASAPEPRKGRETLGPAYFLKIRRGA